MSDTVQEKRPKAVSMLTVHAGRGSGELENCLCVVSGHNASRQLPSPPPFHFPEAGGESTSLGLTSRQWCH